VAKYDNLNDNAAQIRDLFRRIHNLETSSPLNNSAIGRGGIEVYDQGTLNISDGHLIVNGTATFTGTFTQSGPTSFTGTFTQSGPSTFSGTTNLNGPTNISGVTSITGNVTTTGAFKNNGPTELNGSTKTTGTLSVDGATTLNNTLTVASGKKITLGGLTLENQSATSGQVQFPGGGISASAALGMLITHGTVEIAGTTVKISSLPTTSQAPNLYADSSGRLYRSNAL
jgi:hypothetical protein